MRESLAEPQCYPQLVDDAKYQASEVRAAEVAEDAAPELAVEREQVRCWLRCDICARWRLVGRRPLLAVDPVAFATQTCGAETVRDWHAWSAGAAQRYAACRDGHALRAAAHGSLRRAQPRAQSRDPPPPPPEPCVSLRSPTS